jgi:dolichol-phosphate mannosyltransferase
MAALSAAPALTPNVPQAVAADRPDLSLVIPVYDEVDNLVQLGDEIRSTLRDRPWHYEVLFVDDGSHDGSFETLMGMAQRDHQIRILRLACNAGQSCALGAGLRAARAAIVVTLDADLQNDPRDIPLLVAALEGCDIVSGIRQTRQDGWLRRVSSRLANAVRRWTLGDSITDMGCSLKAYRAEWLEGLPVFDGIHRFLPALLEARGAVVKEIPVHHRPRIHGQSKYGIHNRLWRGLYDLVGAGWLSRRWGPRAAVEETTSFLPRES